MNKTAKAILIGVAIIVAGQYVTRMVFKKPQQEKMKKDDSWKASVY